METVVCAAILTKDGAIIMGHRHHNCLNTIEILGLERGKYPDAQGFITSTGRFVTREEGRVLQERAGIPSAAGQYRGDTLYSEDLY